MFGRETVDLGSSPRMRGTPLPHPQRRPGHRIIPAHAGNSPGRSPARPRMPDHPRACGELSSDVLIALAAIGSSPRMRGTPHRSFRLLLRFRIIPAHAGNSWSDSSTRRCPSDHPRACGELTTLRRWLRDSIGSSPRMRGTLKHESAPPDERRIIPAHAGNSRRETWQHARWPDHPRACGELIKDTATELGQFGSSPRMRGTLFPRTTTNTGFI